MFLLTLIFISACSSNEIELSDKPIIAVSIVPQQTFVKAVCGDLTDVITMIPPGSSPENYEPDPRQIEKFGKASIYFSIGVPAEQSNILSNIESQKVISLQDEVASVYTDLIFESGERDPHIWLSPKRVKIMIEVIANVMSEIDKENKDIYISNANLYIQKLEDLDKAISSLFKNVKNKKIIVYHPAFQYIADDYSLEMYALEHHGKEATPQHMQKMIDLAKREGIKTIFCQDEIDGNQSEAFAEEIEGKTIRLAPLDADYIENMYEMAEAMAEAMK